VTATKTVIVRVPPQCWQETEFARTYDDAKQAESSPDLIVSVKKLAKIFADTRPAGCGADKTAVKEFITALHAEQHEGKKKTEEYLYEVTLVAQRFWSSSKTLTLADGRKVEFCSLLNSLLREDRSESMKHLTRICRTINELSVTRGEKVEFPEDRRLFRY